MRKNGRGIVIISILLVISVLFCTGCKDGGILVKSPDLNVPFQSDVKVQAGELEFEGTVKRYGMGIWNMAVTAPETLEGLNISYNDEGVTAELDGLTMEIAMEDINSGAVFAQIFKAVDSAAAAGTLSCTDSEDGKIFSGEFSGGTYKLIFEPQSLTPTAVEIPSAGIFCELRGFSIITVTDPSSQSGQTAQTEQSAPMSGTEEQTVQSEETAVQSLETTISIVETEQ
ncbi:MAG: hypothetical protein J1E40_01745 [Oscillospiraceae bacterium]|nr:hypothetical protein [Oscillospiraceae bacterium]